jgi:hypothetical protein
VPGRQIVTAAERPLGIVGGNGAATSGRNIITEDMVAGWTKYNQHVDKLDDTIKSAKEMAEKLKALASFDNEFGGVTWAKNVDRRLIETVKEISKITDVSDMRLGQRVFPSAEDNRLIAEYFKKVREMADYLNDGYANAQKVVNVKQLAEAKKLGISNKQFNEAASFARHTRLEEIRARDARNLLKNQQAEARSFWREFSKSDDNLAALDKAMKQWNPRKAGASMNSPSARLQQNMAKKIEVFSKYVKQRNLGLGLTKNIFSKVNPASKMQFSDDVLISLQRYMTTDVPGVSELAHSVAIKATKADIAALKSTRTASRTQAQLQRLKVQQAKLNKMLAEKTALTAQQARKLANLDDLIGRIEFAIIECGKVAGTGRSLLAFCSKFELRQSQGKLARARAQRRRLLSKLTEKARIAIGRASQYKGDFAMGYKIERQKVEWKKALKAQEKIRRKAAKAQLYSRRNPYDMLDASPQRRALYWKERLRHARKVTALKKAAYAGSLAKAGRAGSSRTAVNAGKVLKRAAGAGKVAVKALGVAGTVVAVGQAGKIFSENQLDKAEFERLLRKGIYDAELAKRIKHAGWDMVLGRGSTAALIEACTGKGGKWKNTKACAEGAKDLGKALWDLAGMLAKKTGTGMKNCALAGFSDEHECALGKKETWVKLGNGVSNLTEKTGAWLKEQWKGHAKNRALKKEREAFCEENPEKCEEEERIKRQTLKEGREQ